MANQEKHLGKLDRVSGVVEEDPDDLVGRVSHRLVHMERGRIVRRTFKRLFVGSVILGLLGGGVVLLWRFYGQNIIELLPPDLRP